jgi:hypothetical protein
MLKDAGDRVYKLGGWMAGEKNVSFGVVVGASASPLGNSRVCMECITSRRYICFWMT